MAQVPVITRVSREDLNEAPNWIEKLLYPLNLFMAAVTTALAQRLTFQENIQAVIKDLRFETTAAYVSEPEFPKLQFTHALGRKPFMVLISTIANRDLPEDFVTSAVDWTEVNGLIKIRYISGLKVSTRYAVRFLVV